MSLGWYHDLEGWSLNFHLLLLCWLPASLAHRQAINTDQLAMVLSAPQCAVRSTGQNRVLLQCRDGGNVACRQTNIGLEA